MKFSCFLYGKCLAFIFCSILLDSHFLLLHVMLSPNTLDGSQWLCFLLVILTTAATDRFPWLPSVASSAPLCQSIAVLWLCLNALGPQKSLQCLEFFFSNTKVDRTHELFLHQKRSPGCTFSSVFCCKRTNFRTHSASLCVLWHTSYRWIGHCVCNCQISSKFAVSLTLAELFKIL